MRTQPFIVCTPSQMGRAEHARLVRSVAARKKRFQRPVTPWLDAQADSGVAGRVEEAPVRTPRTLILKDASAYLPEGVQLCMLDIANQFLDRADEFLFPASICLPNTSTGWKAFLKNDKVLVYSLISGGQAFLDQMTGRGSTPAFDHYNSKAIQSLQERIASQDETLLTSDPTIMTIVIHAMAAELFCSDNAGADRHLHGLHTIVSMRGGLEALASKDYHLPAKVCRVDIDLAIQLWRRPLFFAQNLSWEPYFSGEGEKSLLPADCQFIEAAPVAGMDHRILNVWRDLRHFCRLCDLSHQSGYKIKRETYADILTSVLYRLLHLSFPHAAHDEAFRLGMVAMAAKAFMPWSHDNRNFSLLQYHLEDSVESLRDELASQCENYANLLFWLQMQCLLLRQHGSDEGMKDTAVHMVNAARPKTWEQARQILKSVLWAGVLHDAAGKKIFFEIPSL